MASANSLRAALLALALALAAAPVACTDEAPGGAPAADAGTDARAGDGGTTAAADASVSSAPPPIECFKGTPRTHQELLNACWPETVTAISKTPTLPGGYTVGAALPPLPQ